MSQYDPQRYWDDLLERHLDEKGVAYQDLPVAFNQAMYQALLGATNQLLEEHGVGWSPHRVLDVGSGTGIWVDFWLGRSAGHVVGVDLTEAAVAALRSRYPAQRFVCADAGDANFPVEGQFDMVSAMSVLLHITDEQRWRQAWQNIAHALAPGGHAVLIEPVVAHRWWGRPFDENANSKARPLQAYREAIRAAGLEFVDTRPATVLLANPIDTRSRATYRLMRIYWRLLVASLCGGETRAARVGAFLRILDAPLRRAFPYGPTAKLLLVRRIVT